MKKVHYLIILFVMAIKMITLDVNEIQSYEASITNQCIIDVQKRVEEDEEIEEEYSYNERQPLNEGCILYNV